METTLLYVKGYSLLLFAVGFVFAVVIANGRDILRSKHRNAFVIASICLTIYAGTKQGSISYPFTDPEQRYLIDSGSYVTNNAIYVSFERVIAPANAPLLIDRRPISSTNDLEWVNFTNTTFSAFNQPQTIAFQSATNFNWVVYTTWTPGPYVKTNGVWHAYWGVDKKTGTHLIPVRTCVREGSTVIATPKSKWIYIGNPDNLQSEGTNQ